MDALRSLVQPLVGGGGGSSIVDGVKLVVLGTTVETARRVSSSAWCVCLCLRAQDRVLMCPPQVALCELLVSSLSARRDRSSHARICTAFFLTAHFSEVGALTAPRVCVTNEATARRRTTRTTG
jgi:hypothetical protein